MGAKASLLILLILSVVLGIARTDFAPLRPADKKPKVQITFWNGFTGPDGRVMLEIVRRFNQENPDIEVSMQRIAWATYYNKVMVSALDGRGPEVFVLQSQFLPRMDRAGIVSAMDEVYLQPLIEFPKLPEAFDHAIGSYGVSFRHVMVSPPLVTDFDPRLLAQVELAGKDGTTHRMGVPLDVWPQGLYVNGRIMREIGYVNADGSPRAPRDRDEFLDVLRKVKEKHPDDWGFGFGDWSYNFMSLVPQFGGRFVDENGNPTLDDPHNAEALQFMADLLYKYKLAPPVEANVGGWVGFRQQNVAMTFDGIYMLGDLKLLDNHPYFGAPIPQVGPHPGSMGGSHVLCLRKNLSPEQRSAGERFIRYLSDHSLEWASAGQVPARQSVRDDPAFKQMPVQSAFAKQLPDLMFLPKTPSVRELQLALGAAIERTLRSNMPATESLKIAQQDYTDYLKRDKMERDFSDKEK